MPPSPVGARYTTGVFSVVDDLRERTRLQVLAMPASARIALALSLGDQDLELFMRASRLDRPDALRTLCAQRASGRRHHSESANPSR